MSDKRSIYIQNLPSKATRDDIWNAFIIFGEITNVTLGDNKETCKVEFEEAGDALAALDNMNLSELYGQTIIVSLATKTTQLDRRKPIWDAEFNAGEA